MDQDRELETISQEPEDDDANEWDGSEAELVADDDAAVYEDVQTGIRLNYTLREEEIYQCLKNTGYIKTTGMRAVIETIVLAIAAIIFLVNFIADGFTGAMVMAVVCVILIAVIWLVPELGMRHQAKKQASGEEFTMEIYPDSIVVEKNGQEWEIPLDGESASCAQYENIVALFYQGKIVILPLRCVEPAVLPEVQAMIIAGTLPHE